MKRPLRILLVFLPGIVITALGVGIALWRHVSIENAVTTQGKIERVYTRVQRDNTGESKQTRVTVSFPAVDGKTSTLDTDVFSTLFLSEGTPVKVRYNARDPTKAKISAGFFAEPYEVGFTILFGAFWLAIPTAAFVYVRTSKYSKYTREELIEEMRRRQEARSASASTRKDPWDGKPGAKD